MIMPVDESEVEALRPKLETVDATSFELSSSSELSGGGDGLGGGG